jgi:hypothetical protein
MQKNRREGRCDAETIRRSSRPPDTRRTAPASHDEAPGARSSRSDAVAVPRAALDAAAAPVESLAARRRCPACKKSARWDRGGGADAARADAGAGSRKLVEGARRQRPGRRSYGAGKWNDPADPRAPARRRAGLRRALAQDDLGGERGADAVRPGLWASGTAYAKQDAKRALATWSDVARTNLEMLKLAARRRLARAATTRSTGRSRGRSSSATSRARRQPPWPDRGGARERPQAGRSARRRTERRSRRRRSPTREEEARLSGAHAAQESTSA